LVQATHRDDWNMRVLSGIQPSGALHIGNYFGALRQFIELQNDNDAYYFVADYHALTSVRDPAQLRAYTFDVMVTMLSLGLDPDKATLFVQSDVPETTELAWLLSTVTPMGWLEKAVSYKDKIQQGLPAEHGLFAYPVLQAADILLYDADFVPVGEDQRQHVEMSRDIAKRFNALFGETFKVPGALIRESGSRIMGLDDPSSKMSKSLAERQPGHAIGLLDPPGQARRAIMRAVTDSRPGVDFGADLSPGVENLLTIWECLTGGTRQQSRDRFDGAQYGVLKAAVADEVTDLLAGIQRRYHEVADDRGQLDKLLSQGAVRARAIAAPKLAQAYRACGLRS
jgi:tryptophanyl-tRNA synthetase